MTFSGRFSGTDVIVERYSIRLAYGFNSHKMGLIVLEHNVNGKTAEANYKKRQSRLPYASGPHNKDCPHNGDCINRKLNQRRCNGRMDKAADRLTRTKRRPACTHGPQLSKHTQAVSISALQLQIGFDQSDLRTKVFILSCSILAKQSWVCLPPIGWELACHR